MIERKAPCCGYYVFTYYDLKGPIFMSDIEKLKQAVVDAAVVYRHAIGTDCHAAYVDLMAKVGAYQNAELATSASHEAVVDDEPCKNCGTCRWVDAPSVCGERDCLGMDDGWRGWEEV